MEILNVDKKILKQMKIKLSALKVVRIETQEQKAKRINDELNSREWSAF